MIARYAWFVTGTDTDAGKTTVARALLLAGRARGLRVCGYKPIESGCAPQSECGADAALLALASQSEANTSYVFEAPIAPYRAAQLAGESVSIPRIQARAADLSATADLLLIEGAGGLLVPLAPDLTIADLAVAVQLPLLIVAPDALGAINHSLLTIACARARGLRVDALILSERDAGGGAALGNAEQIRSFGKVAVLQMPHAASDEALGQAGEHLLQSLQDIADAASTS
jgi:dethiobiotin synthetase